ncbi:triose-phosphate transporter family-domain-containing protein [Gorgonomyces haynaldii]|nr:triose-phosphate transporter family-domain-containing protein [Gorgonomyces haynaldii]
MKDLESQRQRFHALGPIFLNIFSSVGIVIANKWVFNEDGFSFGTLLTAIHFLTTFAGLLICSAFGIFERKHIPIPQVLPLSIVFAAFVVLTNLSLVHNSVGFYQTAKVLTTPTVLLIQFVFYKIRFQREILLSLGVTCIGVVVAGLTDVQFNWFGCFLALAGVLAASLYQIWIGTKQKDLGVNSFQLLLYQAPLSGFMLLAVFPFLDDMELFLAYDLSISCITHIAISCLLAFLVNLSTFLIIGRTSPITYNVVGHSKLCLVILMGFIVFQYPVHLNNVAGVVITLLGVVWYTHVKLRS